MDSSADYQKTIVVKGEPAALFDALTTLDGLAAWWTAVTGSGVTGGELAFTFNHADPCVMHVDHATRPTSVQWTVTACNFEPDWVGTRPTFTIVPVDGETTELRFRHHGLTPALDCIEQCTRGWDHFLGSFRDLVETGQGSPNGSPGDRARRTTQDAR